jgi:hypothetical protein
MQLPYSCYSWGYSRRGGRRGYGINGILLGWQWLGVISRILCIGGGVELNKKSPLSAGFSFIVAHFGGIRSAGAFVHAILVKFTSARVDF